MATSPENQLPLKAFGWAARDTSGLLSPFHFSRRYPFPYPLSFIAPFIFCSCSAWICLLLGPPIFLVLDDLTLSFFFFFAFCLLRDFVGWHGGDLVILQGEWPWWCRTENSVLWGLPFGSAYRQERLGFHYLPRCSWVYITVPFFSTLLFIHVSALFLLINHFSTFFLGGVKSKKKQSGDYYIICYLTSLSCGGTCIFFAFH